MSANPQRKKVGNYYLVGELGRGQFGVVYKGLSVANPSRHLAIKCIPKEKLEKHSYLGKLFKAEVQAMCKLNSPHIMHLFEMVETTNNYYLVMNFCNGGDLEKHIE